MKVLATLGCDGQNCPTVYMKDEETLVIQGFSADNLFTTGLPAGEQAVEVPISLIRDLKI